MSKRTQQIESTLSRTLAQVLAHDLADPRIEGSMVSITRVHISPDLHEAQVYLSVMPQQKEKLILTALRHASRHIQKLASGRLAMRTVPHLDFHLDESLKKQAQVFDAIRQGIDRTGQAEPQATPPTEDAPQD